MRFNNLSTLPQPKNNQPYITNINGWDYIECFRSYNKVMGTHRNKWMFASLNNLIYLNPEASDDEILDIALSANKNRILPKLSKDEINKMIDSLRKVQLNDEITPNYMKRKIIFNSLMNFSGKERKILSLQANIEMKGELKRIKLYEIIESWDFNTYGKITQRSIIGCNAGIGKKAVEKYYSEFREYIKNLNDEFMS